MSMTETHKGSLTGTLQSKTYYFTGFGKGDEVADYTDNYKTDGTTVRNTSIMFYEGNRASASDIEDAMSMTETHKGSLTGTLQSKTYYFTGFGKGDEVA